MSLWPTIHTSGPTTAEERTSSKLRNLFAYISSQLFVLSTMKQGLYIKISLSKFHEISRLDLTIAGL